MLEPGLVGLRGWWVDGARGAGSAGWTGGAGGVGWAGGAG